MKTKNLVAAALFAALITLGAYISVPLPMIPGVPFTLQVLFVILTGVVLEAKATAMAVIVYILLGLAGVPVFHSGTAGPGILAGPTGGYILGFLPAAYCIGRLTGKFSGLGGQYMVAVAAVLILHAVGLLQLSLVTGMSLVKGFWVYTLPFLPVDLVKVAIAVPLGRKIRRSLVAAGLLE